MSDTQLRAPFRYGSTPSLPSRLVRTLCGLPDGKSPCFSLSSTATPHKLRRHIIGGGSAGLKPHGLADHEGYGFGLGLADLLGGKGAALSPVQHLVADLMRQSREFLGRLHAEKQRDLPAVRQA